MYLHSKTGEIIELSSGIVIGLALFTDKKLATLKIQSYEALKKGDFEKEADLWEEIVAHTG
jgi:hypothetical protein